MPVTSAWSYCGALRAFLKTVLLRTPFTGVASGEAGLLEHRSELGVELDERPGDAEAQGTGLAVWATAVDGGVDVVDRWPVSVTCERLP